MITTLPKDLTGPTPLEMAKAFRLDLFDEGDYWKVVLPETWRVDLRGVVFDIWEQMRWRVYPPSQDKPASWTVFPMFRLFSHKLNKVEVMCGRKVAKVFEKPGTPVALLELRARRWLHLRFPNWEDPLAYWDARPKFASAGASAAPAARTSEVAAERRPTVNFAGRRARTLPR